MNMKTNLLEEYVNFVDIYDYIIYTYKYRIILVFK